MPAFSAFGLVSGTPTLRGSIQVGANGKLRTFDANNALIESTMATLPLNQWVRVEWMFVGSSSAGTRRTTGWSGCARTCFRTARTSTFYARAGKRWRVGWSRPWIWCWFR
jgi:hypothetical protein